VELLGVFHAALGFFDALLQAEGVQRVGQAHVLARNPRYHLVERAEHRIRLGPHHHLELHARGHPRVKHGDAAL
jgi:hypothetical protein